MCDCDCDTITNGPPPVAATVGPNLTLSNLYAGNVFTNFINVSYLQINSVNGTAGQVLTATGTGSQIYWSTPSGGGSSQWTTIGAITPNPIYYSNAVGIGSAAVPTATLMVTGNIYASNSTTTTNIISPGITSIYGPTIINGKTVITAVNTITGLTAMDRVNCYEPYFVNASASSAFSLYKRVVYTNFFAYGRTMPTGCLNPTTGKYYTFDSSGYLYTTDENGFLIRSSTQWFTPGSTPCTTLRYYNGLLFACDTAVDQQVFYINAPDNPMVTSGALSGVFTLPVDLFIDKSGKIFVTDAGPFGVWIFQSYLDTSPTFVPITFPSGMDGGPYCICGDSLGYLYVTFSGSIPSVATKIDQTGTILATYASPNPDLHSTNFVYGIAVDNFFNVYIGDTPGSATFGQIHKFLNDGTHVAFITSDTISLYTIIYEPSSDKLIYFWGGASVNSNESGFDILFTESQIYGKGNTSYIGITGTSLDLSGSDASRPTLKVTGNVYSSNSLTTTNVFASRFYGDGGFLSNITSGGFTQPLANLVVSNSVTTTNLVSTSLVVTGAMTSNVSNTTLFYDTLTIPYMNTLQLTALSIISTGGISRFSNLIVSNLQVMNTLQTTNIIADGFSSNVTNTNFNYDTLYVPYLITSNVTVGPRTTTLGSNLMVISNSSGGSNVTIFTGNAMSIGTLDPTFGLHVATPTIGFPGISGTVAAGTNYVTISSSTGAVTMGAVIASDIRLKSNIQPLTYGLATVSNLNPVSFTYISGEGPCIGFIAQDMINIVPEVVNPPNSDGYLSIDYEKLTAVLANAVKEANEKLETAQNDIDFLETRLSDLEALVRTLLPPKEDQVSSGPRSAALMNQMS